MQTTIKGNKVIINNGTTEIVYEQQANGDLVKVAEKLGGIVIWTRPNPKLFNTEN